MTLPLAGTTAVVTGASRGIGAATARALACAGVRVVLIARDAQRLHDLAGTLPCDPVVIPCDLASSDSTTAALAAMRASIGVPGIVVSNAGAFALGRIGALPLDDVTRMLDVNLLAPYRVLHHLVPALRERGSGHVVSIGSIADHTTFPENGGYSASKFGARAVHEVLRAELRGSGVRTTLVSPGPVDTEMWDAIQPETRPGFQARGDMLRPEDVAEAVLWAVTRAPHVNVEDIHLGRA